MILDSRTLVMYGWFLREGDAYTSPAPGVCGANAKPDGDDAAYIDLGKITTFSAEINDGQKIEVFGPVGGNLQRTKIVRVRPTASIKFTSNEVGPLAMQIAMRSQKLDGDSAQFNQLAGTVPNGWLHAQLYDNDGNLFLTLDWWGQLDVKNVVKSDDQSLQKAEYEFDGIYSQYNSSALA